MIIKLKDKNKDFGYVISKNPNSEMDIKSIRQGKANGYWNNDEYFIHFKDLDKVSYGRQDFEYLDNTRYNSPQLMLSLLDGFLSSTFKKESSHETNELKSIEIRSLDLKYKRVQRFVQYFTDDYKIDFKHLNHNSYILTITTEKSWYELTNLINLMMMFITVDSWDEYIKLDKDGEINKYLRAIEILDAPFFVRYMFANKVLKSKKIFTKYKSRLNSSKRYKIDLDYGSTADQRRNKIEKILSFENDILDVGCGEGFYTIPFSRKVNEYHAVDIDESVLKRNIKSCSYRKIDNVRFYSNINDVKINNKIDIILTEVIEHMPLEDSIKLIKRCLEFNFETFVLTVPNKDFNVFYDLKDNEMRHHDHNWEMRETEFQYFITILLKDEDVELEFIKIGDKVNDISTSIGYKITREVK